MKIIFDDYTWKARILVAVIVTFPILLLPPLASYYLNLTANSTVENSIPVPALFLLVSMIVRQLGLLAEKQMIAEWGGYPSTIILRWRDNSKSNEYKQRIHKLVLEKLGIGLLSKDEEYNDPREADKRIQDAFGIIKRKIWGNDTLPTHSDNIDYGFARNLFGCRWLWFSLCVLVLGTSGLSIYFHSGFSSVLRLVISGIMLIAVPVIEWKIVKPHVKHCAFRFAEHAWDTIDDLS